MFSLSVLSKYLEPHSPCLLRYSLLVYSGHSAKNLRHWVAEGCKALRLAGGDEAA